MNTNTRFDQLPVGSYFYIHTTTSGKQNICFYLKAGTSRACRCEVQEGTLIEVYSQDIRQFTPTELVTRCYPVPLTEVEAVIVASINEHFGKLNKKAESIVSNLRSLAREKGIIE